MANDPKGLWKEQPVSVTTYSPDQLRARLRKQHGAFRLRNLVEYVAGGLVILGFGSYLLLPFSLLIKVSCVVLIASTLYVMRQLHQRASAARPPAEGDLASFHREQLMRQHEALSTVWRWYLLPFVPGMTLMLIAQALVLPTGRWLFAAVGCGLILAVFGLIWALNHHAAREIARQIDELDRLGGLQ